MRSQRAILEQFAAAKGWNVVRVVEEYGSGVNDERKKLRALLVKPEYDILLVEHRDRLTRFGFSWFELLAPVRIEVVNEVTENRDRLMEDLVAILTSFSARLYGQRRGREKSQAAIEALKR